MSTAPPPGLERAHERYINHQVEFSLRDMSVGGKKAFEAPAQSWVKVVMPKEMMRQGEVCEGDIVYRWVMMMAVVVVMVVVVVVVVVVVAAALVDATVVLTCLIMAYDQDA